MRKNFDWEFIKNKLHNKSLKFSFYTTPLSFIKKDKLYFLKLIQMQRPEINIAQYEEKQKISLSHSPKQIGAFLCHNNNSSLIGVGLDIEEKNRIHPALILRILSPQEKKLSPLTPLIWSMKEASFKSLRRHPSPPQVLSQIHFTSLSLLESYKKEHYQDFRAQYKNAYLQGWGFTKDTQTYAFAVCYLGKPTNWPL